MNILYIDHYCGSPSFGMQFRPYHFAKLWCEMGHRSVLVGASFSHLRKTQPVVDRWFLREEHDGITYIWIKTPKYKGNGLGRIINILTFIVGLFVFKNRIIREMTPDIVVASSTYPLDIYPCYSIAKTTRSKLVFEVHDLWPLTPIMLAGYSKWHPYIMLLQIAETFAYRNSDAVVSLLPNAKDYMVQHGMDADKFACVSNGIEIDSDNTKKNSSLPDLHKQVIDDIRRRNRRIVGYVGGHALSNALDYFIDAAKILESDDVVFVLIGEGANKDELKDYAINRLGLKNIHFLPGILREQVPNALTLMDILYLGSKNSPLYEHGIASNKLFDYMLAKKPVIMAINAGNDIVTISGCGVTIEPENPDLLAETILEMLIKPSNEIVEMGQKGYEYVTSFHTYKYLADLFVCEVERIAGV